MNPLITAVAILLTAGTAAAAPATPPMPDAALAAQRGGLATPFGIDIGFGADVRTLVNGQLALETQLTWTPQGAQTQVVGGAGSFDPATGTFSAVLPGATGGATQVQQTLGGTKITSVVLNTASNQTIRQDTNITLTLPQLPALQRQFASDRIAATVQAAVGLALRTPH